MEIRKSYRQLTLILDDGTEWDVAELLSFLVQILEASQSPAMMTLNEPKITVTNNLIPKEF